MIIDLPTASPTILADELSLRESIVIRCYSYSYFIEESYSNWTEIFKLVYIHIFHID